MNHVEVKSASQKNTDPREDYYEVLNVPYGASKSLVRESYIRLKSAFSASNNAFYSLISDAEAQSMLTRIEDAFRILNDDIRRREYDRSIGFETDESQSSDLAFTLQTGRMPANPEPLIEFNEMPSSPNPAMPNYNSRATLGASQRPTPSVRKTEKEHSQQMLDLIASGESGDGLLYKKLRELAGVSDDEMQARTKVCIQYIRAIEANDFQQLPQPVFVKGFLRSYLRYLAVPDADRMVKAFADKHDEWIRRVDK